MAMPTPCAAQGGQAEPTVGAGAGAVVLPEDVLRDILLRLPAKTLCRFRAVCRSWRSFLSDPLFIAAHKSKHPGPLIVTCIRDLLGDGGGTVNIMDLSGHVVRRMTTSIEDATLLCTRLDLICVTGQENCYTNGHVIDPATGHTLALPYKRAHVRAFFSYAFELGQVVSTGEYKALRCVSVNSWSHGSEPMISEVITLGGGGGDRHARWRERPCPPCPVTSASKKSVVVNGVVYFLLDFGSHRFTYSGDRVEPCSVACFDLETEEWMGTLRGPIQVRSFVKSFNGMCSYSDLYCKLSLVNINGFLVMVQDPLAYPLDLPLDLWFLIDIEKCLWDRKYSIAFQYENLFAQPLLILEDGRIAIGASNLLRIYDPVSESYTEFQMAGSRLFAIYTGNLLSLTSSFTSKAKRCATCGCYFIPEADQHCEECMWHLYWLSEDPYSEYHKSRMPLSLSVTPLFPEKLFSVSAYLRRRWCGIHFLEVMYRLRCIWSRLHVECLSL